jgi:hypothetical protein
MTKRLLVAGFSTLCEQGYHDCAYAGHETDRLVALTSFSAAIVSFLALISRII